MLWSNSRTKDILTEYAEGLACNNFDRQTLYHVRQICQFKWMVIYKKSISGFPEKKSSALSFQRVRTVTIDTDGYMTCTCGYVQRMLMPCTHICAVIDKPEYYEPSMFHVRWYKMFNYYYRDKQRNQYCLKTNDAIEDLLQVTRENAYCSNGKYKGIYVKGTEFYDKYEKFTNTNDNISLLMQHIDNEINTNGPILMDNSISIESYKRNESRLHNMTKSDSIGDAVDNDNSLSFGGSSQAESNLSQNATEYHMDVYNTSQSRQSLYNTVQPLVQEMLNTCPTDEDIQECISWMRNKIARNLAANPRNSKDFNSESVYLYAENNTSKKSVKRHKTIAETVMK